MTDRDNLVNEFARLTAPEEKPTPQHFQQSGNNNTQLNVTGNNNHVSAPQDTLGKLIQRGKPWWVRFLKAWIIIFAVLIGLRLLQIHAIAGDMPSMDAWINTHAPYIVPRYIGTAALVAAGWTCILAVIHEVRHPRPR